MNFFRFWCILPCSLGLFSVAMLTARLGYAGSVAKPLRAPRLSELVLNEKLNGLSSDSVEGQNWIYSQYESWNSIRNLTRDDEKVTSFLESCKNATEPLKNPFCILASRAFKKKEPAHRQRPDRPDIHVELRALASHPIKSSRFKTLEGISSTDLSKGLRKIRPIHRLEPALKNALESVECNIPSNLLTALAMRAELEFPVEKYKALASGLYKKAVRCGDPKSDAVIQSSYRLGLIQIWEGHCDQAEQTLSRIPDSPQLNDYRMRITYWRYYCADHLKRSQLKELLLSRLIQEYPLSLHRMVADSGDQDSHLVILDDLDPVISFRSVRNSNLNSIVQAAEILLDKDIKEKNRKSTAAVLLAPFLERFQNSEPAFQLYAAILFKRAGDQVSSFQLIASLFKAFPNMIVRKTLELMYPFSSFKLVQELGDEMDPYLIISLIRQESAFDQNASSSAKAYGLMQLQLATARGFQRVSLEQLYDPKINIKIGIKYFSRLVDRYGGSVDLALAAYNAGPERIKEWAKRYPVENRLLFLDLLPIRETREYVSSIARNYYWYTKLYPAGLNTGLNNSSKKPIQGASFLQSLGSAKSP